MMTYDVLNMFCQDHAKDMVASMKSEDLAAYQGLIAVREGTTEMGKTQRTTHLNLVMTSWLHTQPILTMGLSHPPSRHRSEGMGSSR